MKAFLAYLRQPSTIHGIAAVGALVIGLGTQLATHNITATVALAGLIYGIVHIIMPDNSAAQTSIEKLATDAITAAAQKRLAAAIPQLFGDAVSVVAAIQPTVKPLFADPGPPRAAWVAPAATPVATPVA